MPAPVQIARTHVHSLRLANGAEALVARVLTADGVPGFGFSLGLEAAPARDMAAWDALARSRNVPLYALFRGKLWERVVVGGDNERQLDPFALGSIEAVRSAAAAAEELVLLAPHAHPWELSYCVALAATLAGNVRIAVRTEPLAQPLAVSDAPGIEIDWSLEPAFAVIRWHRPE